MYFQISSADELYGHMNVNYLRLLSCLGSVAMPHPELDREGRRFYIHRRDPSSVCLNVRGGWSQHPRQSRNILDISFENR